MNMTENNARMLCIRYAGTLHDADVAEIGYNGKTYNVVWVDTFTHEGFIYDTWRELYANHVCEGIEQDLLMLGADDVKEYLTEEYYNVFITETNKEV